MNGKPWMSLFISLLLVSALACVCSGNGNGDDTSSESGGEVAPEPVDDEIIPEPVGEEPEPELISNLKEKLFVSFAVAGNFVFCPDYMSGGEQGQKIVTQVMAGEQAMVVPSRFHNNIGLCLFGFPPEETLQLELYDPSGRLWSGTFQTEVDDEGTPLVVQVDPPREPSSVGSIREADGIPTASINVWMPAGMPWGEWRAVAASDSAYAETLFLVEPYTDPTVSILPNRDVNVFADRECGDYAAGDEVFVVGEGFYPNAEYPLGIYRFNFEDEGENRQFLELVGGIMVVTDDQGVFETSFIIEPDYQSGSYYAIAGLDPETEGFTFSAGYHEGVDCFQVP
jgi:hypothetical protein